MKRLAAALAVLLAASAQAGISVVDAPAGADKPAPPAEAPPVASPAPAAKPRAGDPLELRLLTQLAAATPKGNLALSPLSLEQVGALLLAGAGGSTQQELLQAFGGGAASAEAALAGAQARLETLKQSQTAELRLASGVWAPVAAPVKEEYLQRVAASLGAQAQSLDFAQPQALDSINAWFREGTGGLIPKLLDRLSPDTGVVLGNALYFKGRWEWPFDPQRSKPQAFRSPAGTAQRVLMHRDFDKLSYRETAEGQAVRLPFSGGQYEMLVLLPAAGKKPQSLLGQKGAALSPWLELAGYSAQPVRLALPRLDLSAGSELQAPLAREGLATALGASPDYSALSTAPLRIDRVVQRVVLKVDEAGAEAAAATAAVAVRSAAIQPEYRAMIVDRPYLLVLRHRATEAVLAVAVIQDPGESH